MKGGIYPPFTLSYIQHKDRKEGVHTMGQRGVHGLVPAHLMHASSTSLSLQKNTERTQHYELASWHDVHAHAGR